jgi:hypothetical protein
VTRRKTVSKDLLVDHQKDDKVFFAFSGPIFCLLDVVFSLLGPLQPRLVLSVLMGVRKKALKKKEKAN